MEESRTIKLNKQKGSLFNNWNGLSFVIKILYYKNVKKEGKNMERGNEFVNSRLTLGQFIKFLDYDMLGYTKLKFIGSDGRTAATCRSNAELLKPSYDRLIESINADADKLIEIRLMKEDASNKPLNIQKI